MSNSGMLVPARRFTFAFNDGTLGLLAVSVLLFGAALWAVRSPSVEKTDFSLTYVGATIEHEGLGRSLYDITLQKLVRDSLFRHPSPLFFEHPPFEALLFSPLATLPFRTAYAVWALCNATIWLVLIVILRRHLPWPTDDLGYLFFWLLFAPLWVALYQGQSSLLLLALYTITFVKLKFGQEFVAGLALGLGLFKFQFVLPFALIFLFRKKWRFLCGFGTTSIFLVLLSLLAVGWSGFIGYLRFLLAIGSNPQNESFGSAVDMPTIHGLVYASLGQKISHLELNVLVMSLSILLLGLVAWRWTRPYSRASFDLMFAAALAASLVAGSHMFTHDFSPLILAMFLAAAGFSGSAGKALVWPRFAMASSLVLFWAFPIYFVFVAWHCLFLMCPVLLLFTWAALRNVQPIGRPTDEAVLQRVVAG
jgi:Glycosyltransferase family 87